MTATGRQERACADKQQAAEMTRDQQHELLVLIRARETVALADAREYRATLIANFEGKLAAIYKPHDHPIWQQAYSEAESAARDARARIAATFRELGIPAAWAPGLTIVWFGRGENAASRRRAELRRVAASEAEKRLRAAEAAIKRNSAEVQAQIVRARLSSAAAHALLATIPAPEQLMPELDMGDIERLVAPQMSRFDHLIGGHPPVVSLTAAPRSG